MSSIMSQNMPGHVAQLVAHPDSRTRGPGFDTQSGHLVLFLLLLIQEVVSYW